MLRLSANLERVLDREVRIASADRVNWVLPPLICPEERELYRGESCTGNGNSADVVLACAKSTPVAVVGAGTAVDAGESQRATR